jgi:hypothetical protein
MILGRLESLEIQVKSALWPSRLGILVGEAITADTKRDKVMTD